MTLLRAEHLTKHIPAVDTVKLKKTCSTAWEIDLSSNTPKTSLWLHVSCAQRHVTGLPLACHSVSVEALVAAQVLLAHIIVREQTMKMYAAHNGCNNQPYFAEYNDTSSAYQASAQLGSARRARSAYASARSINICDLGSSAAASTMVRQLTRSKDGT